MLKILSISILAACAGVLLSCSGHRVGMTSSNIVNVEGLEVLSSPIKVFHRDGTIFLFRDGASTSDSLIAGSATVMLPTGEIEERPYVMLRVSDIVGATLYEFRQSGGSAFGAVWTGVLGGASAIMAITCITNPKSCFGSCPTVYAPHADSMQMVAEMFSTSISPSLASDDLDFLYASSGGDPIPLKITNEALETHYIDRMELVFVEHDTNAIAMPGPGRSIAVVNRHTTSVSGTDANGASITDAIKSPDGYAWRSGPDALLKRPSNDPFDHIDVIVPTNGADTVDLVVRWRNSLLSTLLFYNMVLGDQGLKALAWQHRLDRDPVYASAFSMLYGRYSGVRASVQENGTWRMVGNLTDAGPIVWRTECVRIPTKGRDSVTVRLSCLADNAFLDHIAVAARHTGPTRTTIVPWTITASTVDTNHTPLDQKDKNYLVHDPGDHTSLSVHIPRSSVHGSLFVRSNGFYYEWVRAEWLQRPTTTGASDVINSDRMIKDLGRRWMDQHLLIEEAFRTNRISLR